MKLHEIIVEGISPIVYHYTQVRALNKILGNNQFFLKTSVGTTAEQNHMPKGKYYYLSTTRHKLGGYNLNPSEGYAMLVLDGQALSNRYAGKAIDYWGEDFRKMNPQKFEAEDRIYSPVQTIPNAKSYIKEIHVLMASGGNHHHHMQRTMVSYLNIKKSGIPSFFYKNADAFLLQDKSKTVSLDMADIKPKGKKYDKGPDRMPRGYDIEGMIKLYHAKQSGKYQYADSLPKELSGLAWKLRSGGYALSDFISGLKADIHNARGSDSKNNKFVQKLIAIMRKEKAHTIEDFLRTFNGVWDINIPK